MSDYSDTENWCPEGQVILLIESDETDAALFRLVVMAPDLSAQLDLAKDVEEARDYLERRGLDGDERPHSFPALLVSGLPLLNSRGLDFLRWLRGHNEFRKLSVLAWSSRVSDAQIQELLNAGVTAHAFKSPSTAHLREAIRDILARQN